MDTKTCTKCGETKDVTLFGFKNRAKGLLNSHCNPCRAAAAREWGQRNKDYVREKRREYRSANRDHINALKRTDPYKEKAREATRKRREKNPMPHREEVARWQADNKAIVRGYKRKWKHNNPDKRRAQEKRTRIEISDGYARKLAGGISDLVPLKREQLLIHRAMKQLLQTIKEKQDGH